MFDSSAVTKSEYVTETFATPDGTVHRELAEWQVIDRRLVGYAAQRAALDAAEAFDLTRAFDMRIHAMHGYATFFEYMERRLGYKPHTARERLRVSRALRKLPLLASELGRGNLSFTHARELTRVALPETEEAWIAAAVDKTAVEVQELVGGHAVGDLPDDPTLPDLRPVHLRLELPPEVHALWREARRALAEERGGEVTDADVVETLARQYLTPGTGAERPAHQIAYKQCADCKRTHVTGAGRELDVGPAAFERAACDARNLGDLDAACPQRATTTVTARKREQVFARDHHRCCVPGCLSSRNLDIHHIISQAEGGPHHLWNLMLLCSGHHSAVHDGLLIITGRADSLAFRWTYGAPLPPGLTGAARDAARKERAIATLGGLLLADDNDVPRRLRGVTLRQLVREVPAGTRERSQ